MTIRMIPIGWDSCHPYNQQGDEGRDQIKQRMGGFRYQSETAGEQSHRELQRGQATTGNNRPCRNSLLSSFIAQCLGD